jgi:hypothetical protein
MNVAEPGSPTEGMIARARSLVLHPTDTWAVIDEEPSTIEELYKGWVIPLAAIPAVCRTVGMLGFGGVQIFGVRYRPNFVGIISEAVLTYALTLISVYVLALILDEFALRFGGERSRTQAFKLAAYSGTAGWLGGAFLLLPSIGGLIALLGGLYSLYLLYLGLPTLMRSDPDRTTPYFVLSLVATILLALLIGSLVSWVGGWGGPVSIV